MVNQINLIQGAPLKVSGMGQIQQLHVQPSNYTILVHVPCYIRLWISESRKVLEELEA